MSGGGYGFGGNPSSGETLGTNNFRLTLTSGTPVTTSDVTFGTTIFCTPFNGNGISLYSGSAWATIYASEFYLALGTLANATVYDIFCYSLAGVPVLEFTAWASTTLRATNLVYQDGILVKSGDPTRRYLGTFYNAGNQSSTVTITIASPGVITYTAHGLSANAPVVFTTTGSLPTGITAGTTYYLCSTAVSAMTANTFQISATPGGAPIDTSGSQSGTHTCTVPTYTEDSVVNRFLWNLYNQAERKMLRSDSATSWNYTTATIRQSNGSLLNQLNFVIGINDHLVNAVFVNCRSNTNAGVSMASYIGLDSVTVQYDSNLSRDFIYNPVGSATVVEIKGESLFSDYPGIGKHYLSMLERSGATGTTTWLGTKSAITATIIG